MVVYIIGPSGVGKSTALELLASEAPSLKVVDIDAIRPEIWGDWRRLEPLLESLHQSSHNHVVVDVGAGTQHCVPQFREFLRLREATVLLVIAPPDEVICRNPVPNRSPQEFLLTEYTSRESLYGLAGITVNVSGLAKEGAARKVVEKLRIALDGRTSSSDDPQTLESSDRNVGL